MQFAAAVTAGATADTLPLLDVVKPQQRVRSISKIFFRPERRNCLLGSGLIQCILR